MIAIKLSGGLGNNLFQYATARSIAERKGFRFCYFPFRGLRFYRKVLLQAISRLRGKTSSSGAVKQVVQADLSEYFALEPHAQVVQVLSRLFWRLTPSSRKSRTGQRSVSGSARAKLGGMDVDIFDVSDWTMLEGSFQSFSYFSQDRREILRWLRLREPYQTQLDLIDARIPVPPEHRCCIHIRHGDYLVSDKGFGWKDQGWVLPIEFYRHAISLVPADCCFVVVTDSPDYARANLDFLPNKIVLENNPEAVDISVFGICRFNIVANSTFSLWGAWLNDMPGKQVIAPKYNLGWSVREWVPASMARHPEDWTYIDVRDLVDR